MFGNLRIDTWEEGWRTIKKVKHRLKFVPGSRRKIALSMTGEKKAMYWFDRSRDCWRRAGSILTLHRMLHHALEQYDRLEIPQLTALLRQSAELDLQILLLPTLPKRDKEELQAAFGSMVEELTNVQNEEKSEARDQLSFVVPLADSLGRLNVAVLRTRNTAARRLLQQRASQSFRIKGWVARYFAVVEHLTWQFRHIIFDSRDSLDAIAWDRHNGRIAEQTLANVARDTDQLTLPPFRFTRHIVPEDLYEARILLMRGKMDEARPFVRRAWESLAMQGIRIRLHETLLRSNPDMRTVAWCHNRLLPRIITEKGFRYPGKRDKAQRLLDSAIRLKKAGDADEARNAVKEAVECF